MGAERPRAWLLWVVPPYPLGVCTVGLAHGNGVGVHVPSGVRGGEQGLLVVLQRLHVLLRGGALGTLQHGGALGTPQLLALCGAAGTLALSSTARVFVWEQSSCCCFALGLSRSCCLTVFWAVFLGFFLAARLTL